MREARQVKVSKFGLEVYCPEANVTLRVDQHGNVTTLGKSNLQVSLRTGIYAETATIAWQGVDVWAHPYGLHSPTVHVEKLQKLEVAKYHTDSEAQAFREAYAKDKLTDFFVAKGNSQNVAKGMAAYGNRY